MIFKVKCPECNAESGFSLIKPDYEGPYRCWKCRGAFTITIEKNELKSCEPLSQEEFDRQQAAKELRDKFRRHN